MLSIITSIISVTKVKKNHNIIPNKNAKATCCKNISNKANSGTIVESILKQKYQHKAIITVGRIKNFVFRVAITFTISVFC